MRWIEAEVVAWVQQQTDASRAQAAGERWPPWPRLNYTRARGPMVTAKEEGAERRVLARAKSNIAPDDGGFGYTLARHEVQSGIVGQYIVWGERIDGSARDILGEVEQDDDEHRRMRDEAREFLAGLLADGPMDARRIRKDADGAGYSWSTMFRAARSWRREREVRHEGRLAVGVAEDFRPRRFHEDFRTC